ncbi:MAG: GDP-mannose 4,6-dehydratase [Bacteroidetes bacterium]|nr:GDP-mannose 4,6-dehydratase [Bacteroidota bacterium]
MKVLITGIGGFAGSHLADHIVRSTDASVYGILRDTEKDENLKQLGDAVQLSTCEITDFQSVFKVIKEVRPDIIFHVAGQAFVPSSFEHAAETFKTNVIGTINIFEAVKACEIAPRIIVVTSGEVYGETFGLPSLHTEASIPQPVNPYAASKTSVDYIAQTYKKYEGLNIVIARPFNHTGPRQKPNFVCSSIAKQIVAFQKAKQPIVLRVGNIKARRDFTDVRDIARGYWQLAQTDNSQQFIFNLCAGTSHSIEEIIRMYETIVGARFELIVEPKRLRGYDIQLLAGDPGAIRRATGWKAEIPLQQTLTDLLDYWNHREL